MLLPSSDPSPHRLSQRDRPSDTTPNTKDAPRRTSSSDGMETRWEIDGTAAGVRPETIAARRNTGRETGHAKRAASFELRSTCVWTGLVAASIPLVFRASVPRPACQHSHAAGTRSPLPGFRCRVNRRLLQERLSARSRRKSSVSPCITRAPKRCQCCNSIKNSSSGHLDYMSFGLRPVRFAMRPSMRGPISSCS